MRSDCERRRVLVAAGPARENVLRDLFAAPALGRWEGVAADGLARARFVQQHHPCNLLLVDDDLLARDGWQGLAWLTDGSAAAVVFLSAAVSETVTRAYRHGVHVWLPRDLALADPALLAAALDRAAQLGETEGKLLRTTEQLTQARRHVDRLVGLIWRSAPGADHQPHLFSQRYMLERLEEELARSRRHGTPLTLAVGEVRPPEAAPEEPVDWVGVASARLARAKRACDVAGQYGPQGFLLLLVHTPKEGGVVCCRRLLHVLEQPEADGASDPPLRAYFGLASMTEEAATPQRLLRTAEQNLEAAKSRELEPAVYA